MYWDPLTTCVWKNAVRRVATTKVIAKSAHSVRRWRVSGWKSLMKKYRFPVRGVAQVVVYEYEKGPVDEKAAGIDLEACKTSALTSPNLVSPGR